MAVPDAVFPAPGHSFTKRLSHRLPRRGQAWYAATQGQRAADRARARRRNTAAEGFGDLGPRAQGYLNRIKLFEGIGGYESKVEVLKAKAEKAGVDFSKFGGEGDANAWIDKLARSGPEGARIAARYSSYLNIADATRKAKTSAQSEIAGGYTDLADQIRSGLGGPVDPESGAFQAVGSQYVSGRRQALFDAMTGIDERAAAARVNIDANTLASIGDTLETMRALEEQKKVARIQAGIQIGGALIGSIFGPVGTAIGGAAGTAAGTQFQPEYDFPDWSNEHYPDWAPEEV